MRKQKIPPGAKEVKDQFDGIRSLIRMFSDDEIPNNGLLICGSAGMGKTYVVEETLKELDITTENGKLLLIKGTFTSGSFYKDLWFSREKGNVILIDDADIINQGSKEKTVIIDFLKSATEVGFGQREVQYNRIKLIKEFTDIGVKPKMNFQGQIIWITNELTVDLRNKLKGHYEAISSRFFTSEMIFDDETKFSYTRYLILDEDIFGVNSHHKPGGWSDETIDLLIDFMDLYHKRLVDFTVRNAFKCITQISFMIKRDLKKEEMFNHLSITFCPRP